VRGDRRSHVGFAARGRVRARARRGRSGEQRRARQRAALECVDVVAALEQQRELASNPADTSTSSGAYWSAIRISTSRKASAKSPSVASARIGTLTVKPSPWRRPCSRSEPVPG
jgi:hypothetical protein